MLKRNTQAISTSSGEAGATIIAQVAQKVTKEEILEQLQVII